MPIFEYKCNDCRKEFEILQLHGQNNELKCSGCGSRNLQKMISAPFLPSSVGKPANDDIRCCGSSSSEKKECAPGSCCGQTPS